MCEDLIAPPADESSRAQSCEAQLREARLAGVHLTARELAHRLNNDLAPAVTVLALLQEDYQVPVYLRERVTGAAAYLAQALKSVASLQEVVRVETRQTPHGPALDLPRSTEP